MSQAAPVCQRIVTIDMEANVDAMHRDATGFPGLVL